MLNTFSPADEARHHEQIKAYLGQSGTVESLTSNENEIFVLVKLKSQTLLASLYGGKQLNISIGDPVRLGIGRQFETNDQRIIYHLVAYPNHE